MYGLPSIVPLTEESPLEPRSPLGHALRLCEEALAATAAVNPSFRAAVLRHGVPVGRGSFERLGGSKKQGDQTNRSDVGVLA